MYYLRVNHVDDEDCDLFSFSSLHRAIQYIFNEHLSDYLLSDMLQEFEPEDFTYIEG